ncbi:MAG: serine protease [Actinomycetes bacterium]
MQFPARTIAKVTAVGIALAGAISLSPAAAQAEDTADQVEPRTQSAIVYLETTWSGRVFDTFKYDGEQMGYLRDKPFTVTNRCTGFVVNSSGYIVTAGHCVEQSDDVKQNLISQAAAWRFPNDPSADDLTFKQYLGLVMDDYRVEGTDRRGRPDRVVDAAFGIALSGESSGSSLPARVLSVKGFDKGDVALLKVERDELPSLELATDSEIDVRDPVVSIGFPLSVDLVTDADFQPSYKDGTVSSVKTISDGLLEVYEVNADVSGGMSGGPTVNEEGQVIGLNSFGVRGEPQAFNFVRPAQIIQEMLNDEGVANEIGEVQGSFEAGLDAYFSGDKESAVSHLDDVLAQSPSHELAQEYLAKASQLPDAPAEDSGGHTGLIVGVVLVALTLLAGLMGGVAVLVFWLVRKQRQASVSHEGPRSEAALEVSNA